MNAFSNSKKWFRTGKEDTCRALGISNIMAAPEIVKVVLNTGIKESASSVKNIEVVKEAFKAISGQAPVVSLAKKSIAGFKIREGMPIGVFVTLRKEKMYNFLYKLISFVLPRIRDFNGVHKNFDNDGNYNLGIKDYSIFPEAEKIIGNLGTINGLNISIVFNKKAKNTKEIKNHSYQLLSNLGMPFVR